MVRKFALLALIFCTTTCFAQDYINPNIFELLVLDTVGSSGQPLADKVSKDDFYALYCFTPTSCGGYSLIISSFLDSLEKKHAVKFTRGYIILHSDETELREYAQFVLNSWMPTNNRVFISTDMQFLVQHNMNLRRGFMVFMHKSESDMFYLQQIDETPAAIDSSIERLLGK